MNKFFLFLSFLYIGTVGHVLIPMDYNAVSIYQNESPMVLDDLSKAILGGLRNYIREQKKEDAYVEAEKLLQATKLVKQNPFQFSTILPSELYEIVINNILKKALHEVQELQKEFQNIQKEMKDIAGQVNTLINQQQLAQPVEALPVYEPFKPFNFVSYSLEDMGEESLLSEIILGPDNYNDGEHENQIDLVVAMSQVEGQQPDNDRAYNPFHGKSSALVSGSNHKGPFLAEMEKGKHLRRKLVSPYQKRKKSTKKTGRFEKTNSEENDH